MLEFANAANGSKVWIDPASIVSLQETLRDFRPGEDPDEKTRQNPVAKYQKKTLSITLSNGHVFTVEDPDRKLAAEVRRAKAPWPQPHYLTKTLTPEEKK